MGDSDMSPKARVTYDQHKFQVEFNVSEYLPEVSSEQSVSRNFLFYNLKCAVWACLLSCKTTKLRASSILGLS